MLSSAPSPAAARLSTPGRPAAPAPCRDICMAYAICSSSVMLLRSGSPGRPNSCWPMVIFSSASSESGTGRERQGRAGATSPTDPPPALAHTVPTARPRSRPVSTPAASERPAVPGFRVHLFHLRSRTQRSRPRPRRPQLPAAPPPLAAAAAPPWRRGGPGRAGPVSAPPRTTVGQGCRASGTGAAGQKDSPGRSLGCSQSKQGSGQMGLRGRGAEGSLGTGARLSPEKQLCDVRVSAEEDRAGALASA